MSKRKQIFMPCVESEETDFPKFPSSKVAGKRCPLSGWGRHAQERRWLLSIAPPPMSPVYPPCVHSALLSLQLTSSSNRSKQWKVLGRYSKYQVYRIKPESPRVVYISNTGKTSKSSLNKCLSGFTEE